MHQSIGKKNKIIIYLLFLFILSTTSAKFINDQNTISSSVSKINTTGLSERKNLEISNNLNNFLYENIFVSNKTIKNLGNWLSYQKANYENDISKCSEIMKNSIEKNYLISEKYDFFRETLKK